jgi:hypothetical protein
MIWLLILVGIIWFLKILILDRPAPEPPVSRSFTAAMKYGKVEIAVHYQSQNPIEPRVERAIRLWASDREERRATAEFHRALEAELQAQFPTLMVVSASITPDVVAPEEPKPPTLTDRKLGALLEKRECANELIKATGAELARPLQDYEQHYAKTAINELFHHPDHHE